MSWSQDYSVPSVETLFEQLTGKTARQLLHEELERQGKFVKTFEEVVLDDGLYDTIKGTRVTLTDGRIFVPKLIERFCENGNYGLDVYQYFLEEENPQISYTGMDTAEEGMDRTVYSHSCDVVDMSDGPCGDPSHD
jgi:hypothetical protein